MGKPWIADGGSNNTAAVLTIPAPTGAAFIEIEQLSWSYNATPSAGVLTVESPSGTELHRWRITNGGPGFIPFSGSCLRGAPGQALVVRLSAEASAIGCVNAIQRT